MLASTSLVGSLLQTVSQGVGIDPSLLIARAGDERREARPSGVTRSPHAWLEERAFEVTGDEALGLHLGEQGGGQGFGIVGQLAANSRSLRECIQVALTYYPLILDAQRPELRVEDGRAFVVYPSVVGSPRSLRLSAEFGMARFAQFGKLFVSRRSGLEIWFAHPRPNYAEDYFRVFGPNVRFDMLYNAFVFPEHFLELEQPNWDPALHALLKAEANRALERLSTARVSQRARAVLSGLKLGERPEMAHTAGALGMSERSLRRRLAAEGVCFRELIDDMQRDRALILAKDPKRSAEAVSNALGFSEVSAYHRAFKRWTGLTPAQYRSAHRPPLQGQSPDVALAQRAS
ncbi:MAG: AraC family transcriptional regulator ligand-binding domain-containing protein [Myxococcales bacterium]